MPQLSGPIWVQRFPTSRSTADLTRAFGVIKLASDPPHWSDDGH
jgi:hypothetical protein